MASIGFFQLSTLGLTVKPKARQPKNLNFRLPTYNKTFNFWLSNKPFFQCGTSIMNINHFHKCAHVQPTKKLTTKKTKKSSPELKHTTHLIDIITSLRRSIIMNCTFITFCFRDEPPRACCNSFFANCTFFLGESSWKYFGNTLKRDKPYWLVIKLILFTWEETMNKKSVLGQTDALRSRSVPE